MQYNNCILYSLNSKKKLVKILIVNKNINKKKLVKIFSKEEQLKILIEKSKKVQLTDKKTRNKILNSTNITFNENIHRQFTYAQKKSDYKMILKKLSKILSIWVEKNNLNYLYSIIKNVDYVKNAYFHKENNYFLKIDFKNYFNNISSLQIFNFFKYKLNTSIDIARILTVLSVADINNTNLKQGLETSPILSFLVNIEIFEEIYQYCIEKKFKMSLYVDDLVISSKNPINKKEIQFVFNILIKNKLKINRRKIKYQNLYNNIVIITGIQILKNHNLKPINKTCKKLRIEKKISKNQNVINGLISNLKYIQQINDKNK
ncbi:reverse transcriptase domain-containing protein [Spiroplasma endosymbiont of Danaus chrysippus]|uniref:reverse transcriptase domain-containing protein n=1 Tax=Spiroplasma endosymbiont of Danaus chrysippus TaxID=2691041 RepID=UPI0013CBC758|nr:reverse transcriptase domain-containing protein [Spiroplasma endosymbiont of Danaus chrysippus]CAB1055243.1 Retron-type RNA-directed DNA polymerase (EC 2.7.7.49) [Spiroplasma endosymbiont of Danaus chrysippus]